MARTIITVNAYDIDEALEAAARLFEELKALKDEGGYFGPVENYVVVDDEVAMSR